MSGLFKWIASLFGSASMIDESGEAHLRGIRMGVDVMLGLGASGAITKLVQRTENLVAAIGDVTTLMTRTTNLVTAISDISSIKGVLPSTSLMSNIFDPNNSLLTDFMRKIVILLLGDAFVVP